MSMKDRLAVVARVTDGRFLFLLLTLFLYIGMIPFLDSYSSIRFHLLFNIAFSAIFISAIYAVSRTRRQVVVVTLVALPTVIMTWVSSYFITPGIILADLILTILFLAFAIIRIMGFIFRAHRVSLDVIFAAIVVYLIMGLTWSVGYQLLEHLIPGSLDIFEGPFAEKKYLYTYYSFVTLTTLGYGDVTPLTDIAGSLSIIEAIIGQLYMTVLIARLVGMHIADSAANERPADAKKRAGIESP